MAITRWEPFQELERIHPFGWEPFREIERMQRQINRLMGRISPEGDGEGFGLGFAPSAELEETENAILLRLEVPGMEAKDLDVQVAEDRVAIRGERKSETRTEEKGTTRSEFRYGKFERIIPLPAHVQPGGVKAEYTNGILSINLPKAEEEKRKVVKVNLEQPGAGVEA